MIVLIVLIASAIQFSAGEISIDDLIYKIDRTLDYMPMTYDKNSSYSISRAGAEIVLLLKLDKQKWQKWERKIKEINEAIHTILTENIDAAESNVDKNYANVFFKPEKFLYAFNGDFQYKPGQVRGEPSDDSPETILASSTKIEKACLAMLFSTIRITRKHTCGINRDCMAKVVSTSKDGDISVDLRIRFLNDMAMINCKSVPTDMYSIITKQCSQLYSEVLKLKEEPIAMGTADIYLNKIVECGTFGFPEFFADDIVQPIIDIIQSDGSVGSGSDKDMRKVTAQTMAILTGILRMKIQDIE